MSPQHHSRRALSCLERESELDQLLAAVESHQHVILCGLPGVGKTTLSLALAEQIGAQGRSVSYLSAERVSRPAARPWLTIVDDADSEALAELAHELPNHARSRVLLVSERPLHASMHCLRLRPLACSTTGESPASRVLTAMFDLHDSARRLRPEASWLYAFAVGGWPILLAHVASWLAGVGTEYIAAIASYTPRVVEELARSGCAQVIDRALDGLSAADRRALGVVATAGTATAAACPGLGGAAAVGHLEELGWLTADAGRRRLTVAPAVAARCRARPDGGPDRRLRSALAARILDDTRSSWLRGTPVPSRGALELAGDSLCDSDPSVPAEARDWLTLTLAWDAMDRGRFDEAERALAARAGWTPRPPCGELGAERWRLTVELACARAYLLHRKDEHRQAADVLERAARLASWHPEKASWLHARLAVEQATLSLYHGRFSDCRDHARRALDGLEYRDRRARARALAYAGHTAAGCRDHGDARAAYRRAFSVSPSDPLSAMLVAALGLECAEQGWNGRAAVCFSRARAYLDAGTMSPFWLSVYLYESAWLLGRGDKDAARALIISMAALNDGRSRRMDAIFRFATAVLDEMEGAPDEALSGYAAAEEMARACGDQFYAVLTRYAQVGCAPEPPAEELALPPAFPRAYRPFVVVQLARAAVRHGGGAGLIRRGVRMQAFVPFGLRYAARAFCDEYRAYVHAMRPELRFDPVARVVDVHGQSISLSRYRNGSRILELLVDAHLCAPGTWIETPRLIAATWPDDRSAMAAKRNRLAVEVARLRRLGLRALIESYRGGYRLRPDVRITRRPRSTTAGQ